LTFKGKKSEDAKCGAGYTAVKRTTRAIPVIILQKKIPTNVESFTLTAKLTAVSENVSFLRRVCVENEVTDIHKFYRREIRFIRKFSASISYELHARERLNGFKLQGSRRPEVT